MNIKIPNVKVYNNIFYNVETSSFGGNNQHPVQFNSESRGAATGGEVKNNMFIGCGGSRDDQGWYWQLGTVTDLVASNNYVARLDFAPKEGFPGAGFDDARTGISGGDPRFTGPLTSVSGFKIQFDSPARDKGTAIATFNNDFSGNIRPQGAGWYIGAYEYVSVHPDTAPPAAPGGVKVQ